LKFDKEQLIFMVEYAMNAGLDRIESGLPLCQEDLVEFKLQEKNRRTWFEACIETVGTTLACFWAQTEGKRIGEGMGIGDALETSGFTDLAEKFITERTAEDWPGMEDGEQCHPNPHEIAEKFVDDCWPEAYFEESKFSETGYESDAGVIEYPDPGSGEIVFRDEYGNHIETREFGDDNWAEWYELFTRPEDQFFHGLPVRVSKDGEEWDGEVMDLYVELGKVLVLSNDETKSGKFRREELTPIYKKAEGN